MIRENELLEAIAECQGQRNPNATTCMKLASYYTILDHIGEKQEEQPMARYSFDSGPETAAYDSGTEFSDRINGMDLNKVLTVMDELMTTLLVVNPRLYAGVMRKLAE